MLRYRYSNLINNVGSFLHPYPTVASAGASLDYLILQARPVFNAADKLLQSAHATPDLSAIRLIQSAARTVLLSLNGWPASQPEQWQPRTLAWGMEAYEQSLADADTSGNFPGRIDVYCDCRLGIMA